VIKSFKDKETEKIFRGRFSRKLPRDIQRIAARKLEQIDAATVLETLRIPPGNQLEALKGDRQGQHSIGLTISGGFALSGEPGMRLMLRL
jgi:toxin HigB-1